MRLPLGGDPCGDVDLARSGEVVVPTASNTVRYTVSCLVSGTYLAVAWQDLNRDVDVTSGEPVGIHPNLIDVGPGQARTGVTIEMTPWEPLGASNTTDTGLTTERAVSVLRRWLTSER